MTFAQAADESGGGELAGGPPRRTRHRWRWLLPALAIAALALFPVAGLVYFAARGSGNLWPHLATNVLPTATRETVVLLLGVGAMVTVIGVGAAWLVAMHRFPGRRFLSWGLLLPLAVPTYIIAFTYLDLTHPVGPVQTFLRGVFGITDVRGLWFPEVRSMPGAIVLLGLVLYPYVYLPARALFAMQSGTVLEASRTLGAGRFGAFVRVALPLARPAVAVGLSLALLEALNDIGASEFLGVRTLTVAIYTTWTTRFSIGGAAQIALVMLVFVLALLLLERWARRRQRYVGTGRSRPAVPTPLPGWRGIAAMLACALPILLGFVAPAAYLVRAAWVRVAVFGLPPDLPTWIGNTVTFAAIATATALALGLFLATAARALRSRLATATLRVASIGYAIPGTVLAVGLLVPLASLDNVIANWARATFGISTGLIFLGSGTALIFAYTVRFLAISVGGIEAGLHKVSPTLDMAARSLGAGPLETARRIHLPLLTPAIAAAALLVLVDCMKELPATLLLRPLGFETLATHLYGEAARGTHEAGAVSALAIVLVGLLPVVLLARTGERGFGTRRSTRRPQPEADLPAATP